MPHLLRVPEIAANTTEATLVSWPVAENGTYTRADVIAVVETAKAQVDVEAEADGVLVKRLVTEGTDVGVGEPIALLAAPGESVPDLTAALRALGVGSPPVNGAVDGATDGAAVLRRFASPLARRLARESGLDLAGITGTGPGGRIVRRDVEQAIATTPSVASPPVASPSAVSPSVASPSAVEPPAAPAAPAGNEVPHTRLRRAIAERLSESKRTVPHFYLRGSARVDALVALRTELNATDGVHITVNDLVVKAVARAHTLVPAMNVTWTPDAVRTFDTVDLGVAIATERGLVTPVLRSVETATITAVATRMRDLVDRAAAGTLRQHELEGGTATVSNLGGYGTEEFAAIINPPHAAILAVGAARPEPVAEDGEVRVATVLRCTLSVDHRVVDGALAAEWMRHFTSLLEHPIQILA